METKPAESGEVWFAWSEPIHIMHVQSGLSGNRGVNSGLGQYSNQSHIVHDFVVKLELLDCVAGAALECKE